jgi:hypothetical protein
MDIGGGCVVAVMEVLSQAKVKCGLRIKTKIDLAPWEILHRTISQREATGAITCAHSRKQKLSTWR